jgi:cytochrome c biogenesis protein CcmG/thiol:disulfide interchange protein DsbE
MANNSAERDSLWLDERLATLNSRAEWQPDISRGLALLKARQAHRTRRIWTEVALLAAGLIVLLLPQPRVFAHYCLDCTVSFWQNLSSSGPATLLQSETKRKTAHDFTLNDASGMPVQLSSLKGKVVLLNFWATWCHGCTLEIPWFIEFKKKYEGRGFEVIGISTDDDGWKSVTPYVNEKKVNYTIVIGNPELSKLYRINAMPVTLLLDRDGKVAASWAGVISRADCRSKIETVLGERP